MVSCVQITVLCVMYVRRMTYCESGEKFVREGDIKYQRSKAKQSIAKQTKGRKGKRQGDPPLLRCLIAPLLMAPSLLTLLSYDLQVFFLSLWLDVPSLVNLDVAVSSHDWRPYWMTLLHSLRSAGIDELDHSLASLMWLARRGICARRMQMKVDGLRVRECDVMSYCLSRSSWLTWD